MKILDENYLIEMAIINPKLCKNLSIQVEVEQRDEGPIPHLHVYHNKSRNKKECSYIRLDKPEYSDHHKNSNLKLNKTQKNEFIRVMTEEIPSLLKNKLNGYEYAVETWVNTFEDGDYSKFNFDDDGNLIIPDYTLL